MSDYRTTNAVGTMKILFLGQCLQYGYQGVSRYATYTNVAASILQTQFPELRFKFDFKYLHHPTGLKAILRHRLPVTKPDVAVINLAALFAATRFRVNLIYQVAPELVDTARTFARKIEQKVKRLDPAAPKRDTMIDKLFSLTPPMQLDEYERVVADAISYAKQISGCRIILMGPGGFNEDTIENYEIHNPELWSSVNDMIARLAGRFDLPRVDSHGLLNSHSGEVYTNQNHRYSEYGHSVVGREVASVLAGEIRMLRLGRVILSSAARA